MQEQEMFLPRPKNQVMLHEELLALFKHWMTRMKYVEWLPSIHTPSIIILDRQTGIIPFKMGSMGAFSICIHNVWLQ